MTRSHNFKHVLESGHFRTHDFIQFHLQHDKFYEDCFRIISLSSLRTSHNFSSVGGFLDFTSLAHFSMKMVPFGCWTLRRFVVSMSRVPPKSLFVIQILDDSRGRCSVMISTIIIALYTSYSSSCCSTLLLPMHAINNSNFAHSPI